MLYDLLMRLIDAEEAARTACLLSGTVPAPLSEELRAAQSAYESEFSRVFGRVSPLPEA
jgi:hypothetical protein